jgi:hypothetical protein
MATHDAPGLAVAPVKERIMKVGVEVTVTNPAGEFDAQISFVIAGSTLTNTEAGLLVQEISVFIAVTLYVIVEKGAA